MARAVLPADDALALNRRQADHLAETHEALNRVGKARISSRLPKNFASRAAPVIA